MKARICGVCVAAMLSLPAAAQPPANWVTARLTNADVDLDMFNETSIAVSPVNPLHLIVTCNFHRRVACSAHA